MPGDEVSGEMAAQPTEDVLSKTNGEAHWLLAEGYRWAGELL